MTKEKFIIPLYDTTIKYLIKSERTGPIIFKLIYSLTEIDLSDYVMIDQELNTGNNKTKDYRLDFLFKKGRTLVNLEINLTGLTTAVEQFRIRAKGKTLMNIRHPVTGTVYFSFQSHSATTLYFDAEGKAPNGDPRYSAEVSILTRHK